MQKFPESFRDGSVRGPGLSALQEGLAEIRKYRAASPGPPPTQPPTTNQPGIDVETGSLVAAEGTISPAMNRTEFLLSSLFESGAWSNKSDGWYMTNTIPLTLSGTRFGASVLFHHEFMDSLTLFVDDPQYGVNWDEYSIEKEMKRDARHKGWLEDNVRDWARAFPWGRIWCGFSSKDGFSTIVITYNNSPRRRSAALH